MAGVRLILAALKERGPMTSKDLTAVVGGWVAQTGRDLKRLQKQGYVRSLGDGLWGLA